MRTKESHRRPLAAATLTRVRTLPGFRRYPLLYVQSATQAWRNREDLASVEAFVFFVGHPRSGHSLVGSLLDAHPDMVVAHELDAMRYVVAGYRRDQILSLVIEHSRENAASGRKSWGYSYAVPGQWQGRYRTLTVVGDKRGRRTTARLAHDPTLLDRLVETMGIPVKVLQVVRNPYDNIATMFIRGSASLEHQVTTYFHLCDTADDVARRVPDGAFHRLHLEDLIKDPTHELRALCAHLGVTPDDDYLAACASIVFPSPHSTERSAPWTPELRRRIEETLPEHDYLMRYSTERA